VDADYVKVTHHLGGTAGDWLLPLIFGARAFVF
jgi:hypothetical protein